MLAAAVAATMLVAALVRPREARAMTPKTAAAAAQTAAEQTVLRTAYRNNDSSGGPGRIVNETMAEAAGSDFTACDEIVYVSGDNVNFRETPAVGDGNVIARLKLGARVQRTGRGTEWSRIIDLETGREGYVVTRYLQGNKVESAGAQTESTSAGSVSDSGASASAGSSASSGSASSIEASVSGTPVALDPGWRYADHSKISSGTAMLYKPASGGNGITVCVNAGHGTRGGSSVKTLCHPDGTPKVTGGTTGAGATSAVAVSSGMTLLDGTDEYKVTLACALKLKEQLLAKGYNVLMIREGDDVQLDNVARTVIANNAADCHIALHWDSTESDKGAYYCKVANVASYKAMEPVASHWQQHDALGEALIAGLRDAGVKIWSGNPLESDLTQISYSTVPSVDIELGDRASSHGDAVMTQLAQGLAAGVDRYFGR